MTRFRIAIASLAAAFWMTFAACQAGGGAVSPGSAFAPVGSSIRALPGGTTTPPATDGSGTTPPGAAAAAGGGDTMPPRADAGDCMTIGIDGSVYCGPPRREACRVSYVPAPKMKVMAGAVAPLPPIPLEGKTSFDGRFYAEMGSADLSCEDAACWTWESANFGDVVMMRLTRLQPSAPMLQFHQDMIAELTGTDGANLTVAATPIKDEDTIEFYATLSDARPEGYSESLVPLTDEVWTKFGIKCELGGFRIDTGMTYEKKMDGVVAPGLDDILLDHPLDRMMLKK